MVRIKRLGDVLSSSSDSEDDQLVDAVELTSGGKIVVVPRKKKRNVISERMSAVEERLRAAGNTLKRTARGEVQYNGMTSRRSNFDELMKLTATDGTAPPSNKRGLDAFVRGLIDAGIKPFRIANEHIRALMQRRYRRIP